MQPYSHLQHRETAFSLQTKTQLNQFFLPKHLLTENVPQCFDPTSVHVQQIKCVPIPSNCSAHS